MADPADYDAIERMNVAAPREEVAIPLTAQSLRWLVDENPAGRGFVVLARARADDQVLGHFVFYPKRLRARGAAPITAYLYVSLYVLPAYRRIGVFSAMFRYGIDLLRRAGVPAAYTVPNPRSGAGFLKMGEHLIGRVPFWASPCQFLGIPFSLVAAPTALWAGRGVSVAPCARFDERHERLVADQPTGAWIWGERSLAELSWRFERRPGVTYRIWDVTERNDLVGYAVTRQMHVAPREALVVCDLRMRSGREGALSVLLNALRREPVDLVVAMAGHHEAAAPAALLAAGMLPVPQRLLPQPVAVIGAPLCEGPLSPGMGAGALPAWYVMPFDWDVF